MNNSDDGTTFETQVNFRSDEDGSWPFGMNLMFHAKVAVYYMLEKGLPWFSIIGIILDIMMMVGPTTIKVAVLSHLMKKMQKMLD